MISENEIKKIYDIMVSFEVSSKLTNSFIVYQPRTRKNIWVIKDGANLLAFFSLDSTRVNCRIYEQGVHITKFPNFDSYNHSEPEDWSKYKPGDKAFDISIKSLDEFNVFFESFLCYQKYRTNKK